MNKKQIIQIVVIAAAFIGAGVVLYKGGLFGGSQAAPQTAQVAGASPQEILPYGDTLDFSSVINSSRFQYNIIQYPQLSPQSDVGIPVNNIIETLPPPAPAK